jgi:hypothetical protein
MAEPVKTAEAEVKPKAEIQTNCLSCNKPIRKLKRYYRDSKFYCSKKCWKTFKNKPKEEKK